MADPTQAEMKAQDGLNEVFASLQRYATREEEVFNQLIDALQSFSELLTPAQRGRIPENFPLSPLSIKGVLADKDNVGRGSSRIGLVFRGFGNRFSVAVIDTQADGNIRIFDTEVSEEQYLAFDLDKDTESTICGDVWDLLKKPENQALVSYENLKSGDATAKTIMTLIHEGSAPASDNLQKALKMAGGRGHIPLAEVTKQHLRR